MATKKRALGRGLGNFIKDVPFTEDGMVDKGKKTELENIPIRDIKANEDQPRQDFDLEKLKELSKSIAEVGILQPLIVKKAETGYELIAGERRLRAAKLANLEEVPVIVTNMKEDEVDKVALIENIQRQDLNPLEEAMAYDRLKKVYGYTQEEMSKSLGKSRSYIANTMRLLKLEPQVKDYLRKGQINVSQAKILLGIDNPQKQVEKAKSIVDKGSTVAQTQSSLKKSTPKSSYEISLMERLMERLGTKTQLKGKGKKTKLIIDVYSEEELTRIIEIILGGENID